MGHVVLQNIRDSFRQTLRFNAFGTVFLFRHVLIKESMSYFVPNWTAFSHTSPRTPQTNCLTLIIAGREKFACLEEDNIQASVVGAQGGIVD